jgi:hypothetical protein
VTAPPLIAILLLALDWFPRGLTPVDTGGAATSAKACAACHARAHAEWAGSRHGRAWTNAIFQREYNDKPQDWCVHCHAPLPEQRAQVHAGGGALANEGVTCAVCHVRGGRMQARTKAAGSPHDTEARADFGGPAYCGGCHQFNFPVVEPGPDGKPRVLRYTSRPMQDTERQHAAGPKAQRECLTCHRAENTAGHRFPGGHDAAFVARAVTVETCRDGRDLRVRLANTGAGHNVPTGDLHRHLVLRAWRAEAPERLAELTLGRRFEPDDEGGKRTVADTTIPAGATHTLRVRVAELGGAPKSPIRLELRLVYTIDEFPFRGRELAEPTYVTMFEDERAWGDVEGCKATSQGLPSPRPSPADGRGRRTR